MSLIKSVRLYVRRLQAQAVAAVADKLNAEQIHEFSIAGGQQFDPTFFTDFFGDKPLN